MTVWTCNYQAPEDDGDVFRLVSIHSTKAGAVGAAEADAREYGHDKEDTMWREQGRELWLWLVDEDGDEAEGERCWMVEEVAVQA